MAENDIYDSKGKYEAFKNNLKQLLNPPKPKDKRKYYCKNPHNLRYFETLITKFEALNLSFVRRIRILHMFKIVVHCLSKPLPDVTREDIDQMVTFVNQTLSDKTASDFKKDLKLIWKIILPELDDKGRPDENAVPYVVRHLRTEIDRSKQKIRKDRFTWEEFQKVLEWFAQKPCLHYYLMQAFESLRRPQELLYRKIKDVELHDNYAAILLSDHGKEGTGIIHCIDSYPYLTAWLNAHTDRNNPEAWLFLNAKGEQLTPFGINKMLKSACAYLKILKPITCYSIKRNGVTFRRLRGDDDNTIQKVAGWTSTRQLKVYDLSNQYDVLKSELIKRGIIQPDQEHQHLAPKTKACLFCKTMNKVNDVTCIHCTRPLDREKIAELEYKKEEKLLKDFIHRPEIKEMLRIFIKEEIERGRGKNNTHSPTDS